MRPFPLILSSPSGGGKTTLARLLLERRHDVGYSISCTTRSPRNGEVNGKDYYFLTPEEFRKRREAGDFAESAEVHGNLYGTLRSEVERIFDSGMHVVMDIDVQGARLFAAAYPESVLVFLLPPSAEILLGRLAGRNTENSESSLRRLISARAELDAVSEYQYVVVNDNLERAYTQVASIVDAESVRLSRWPLITDRLQDIAEDLDRRILEHSGKA